MRSIFLFLVLFVVTSAWPDRVLAGNAERPSHLIFQLDNDIFTGSDRDYTNGTRIAWLQPIDADTLNTAQQWLQNFTGASGKGPFHVLTGFIQPEQIEYDWGVGLTQLMFTPSDPESLVPPPGQRPYAGWLGMEFSLHAKDSQRISSVVFSLGVTGKYCQAEDTQNWVHRHISNSPLFQGWDSQIPSEVTVNLNFDRKSHLPVLGEPDRDDFAIDGYFEWGAAVGNFRTHAYLGSLLRAGYNLPAEYMTPRLQLGNYSHDLFLRKKSGGNGWSIYGFGAVRGTLVAHDITLDGPVFRDYAAFVESEPFVGEILIGFGVRYKRLTVTYSRTFRTVEFEDQTTGHQFGSLLAGLTF